MMTVCMRYVLCLSLCLLIAQVLMLLNAAMVSVTWLCKASTALQHVAWLCSFSFMSLILISMAKAFNSHQPIHSQSPLPKSIHAVAVLLPCLIVTACVAFDLQPEVNFVYFRTDLCWLEPQKAVLFMFVLPLSLSMLVNGICFVSIILSIRRRSNEASFNNHKFSNINYLRIACKIMTIMGATWLFGFLANVESLYFLAYPFILLNASQGWPYSFSFLEERGSAAL